MSKKANLYVGRAGQMAVISEFLIRGWNVAVPEVDIGDDLLVIKDENMDVSRIQVKTASASKVKNGYSARYSVRFLQLAEPITPDITYIFVNRLNSHWKSFLVIPREVLYEEHDAYSVGSLTKAGQVSFYFRYFNETVTCSNRDFSTYLNNWSTWPLIKH